MALGSKFHLAIECNPRLEFRNHQFHWNHGIKLQLVIPISLMAHGHKCHFFRVYKLGFFLVRHIPISTMGGQM
jgi:hypothetical protein